DFSRPSLVALRVALKMTMQAVIHVLHVAEAPFEGRMKRTDLGEVDRHRYNLLSRAHPEMKKIIEDYAGGNARVSSIIEPGCAPAVILKHVQSLHIDLVVTGKRGETELDGALFGSVTKHVIYETSCDVLVVSQADEPVGQRWNGTHS
ncbi:MAG TPA: universal stress protein, partial [Nitrosospira sp.]|nr:universal stress protein [Nitrosospira sp.]